MLKHIFYALYQDINWQIYSVSLLQLVYSRSSQPLKPLAVYYDYHGAKPSENCKSSYGIEILDRYFVVLLVIIAKECQGATRSTKFLPSLSFLVILCHPLVTASISWCILMSFCIP